MTYFPSRRIAGLDISRESLEAAVEDLINNKSREFIPQDIHLINAYSIALTTHDDEYYECLKSASKNLPDGRPLSLLTCLSKKPLNQTPGPELFERVLQAGIKDGVRHFFLGSTEETLKLLTKAVSERFPGAQIAGVKSPPFRPMTALEYAEQDKEISNTSPDIVWVGLGTPKQDIEAQRLAAQGFIAVAVGAAFDFTAGTVKRAPSLFSKLGIEWLYRLGTEPKRLWKRYLIGNWVFIYALVARRSS